MPPLDTVQSQFAAAFDQTPAAMGCLLPLLKGPQPLATQRFQLYLNNSTQAWYRALVHAYPVMKALVGETCFRAMAHDYSQSYGSKSGDLNEFGLHFAEFIGDLNPVAQYPYFFDVACLEWRLHCAYYAADGVPCRAEDWIALTPEEVAQARVEFHPAFSLITSKWAIVEIWQAHRLDEHPWPAQIAQTNYGMIVRPAWHAKAVPLTSDAFEALYALHQGHTVEEAIARALAVNPNFDFLSNLRCWIQYAVFVRVLSNLMDE